METEVGIESKLKQYNSDIRRIAYWHHGLWPRERNYEIDDLMQAGRMAVWSVYEKHPDKIENRDYVRGAIRYGVLGEMRRLSAKVKEIHLVRQADGEMVSLVDVLPASERFEEKVDDLDALCHNISKNYSLKEADSLHGLVRKSRIAFDLNLSQPPPAELKDRIKIVTAMDLSNDEMLVYAQVLTGAMERFPHGYVNAQNGRARKYIKFLLKQLQISANNFAQNGDRQELLLKYRLDSFFQRVYKSNMGELVHDIFPRLKNHEIRYRFRWRGVEGLLNAYAAISSVINATRKRPHELTSKDFIAHNLTGLLKQCFQNSHRRAVEFRYPGIYPQHTKEMEKLRSKM